MPKIDDLTRLKHIQQASQEAIEFVEGRTRQDLERERMLSLALVRLIEIIGEAANNIRALFYFSLLTVWRSLDSSTSRTIAMGLILTAAY